MRTILALLLLTLTTPTLAQNAKDTPESQTSQSSYRMSGAAALRPARIWDDGFYTYIEWPESSELPAVFSKGSDGKEVIAEGAMIGDAYVLDRVHANLIFRIGTQVAGARRRAARP